MVEYQLLARCQHGFIKGRSCVTQLLAVLDKCTEALNMGNKMDVIQLCSASATPNENRRLSGKIRKWIKKSASGGQWHAVAGGACSEWNPSG